MLSLLRAAPKRPRLTDSSLGRFVSAVLLALMAAPIVAHHAEGAPASGVLRQSAHPPLPPPRPTPTVEPIPTAKPADPAPLARGPADADPAACLDRLAKLGVSVEPRPAIAADACGARYPFSLNALPGGIALAPAAVVGCPIADALARWVAEVVTPDARTHLGRAPVKILIGASYECRGRNRVFGATLSEHAFANAIDIMGFAFETGAPVSVKAWPAETPEARFLAAIRARACAHFTTVLGPGSDAAHGDHLHLDGRERKRGFRLCQ